MLVQPVFAVGYPFEQAGPWCRSWFRVISFHILFFQALAIWDWNGTPKIASSLVLTHAGLCLLSHLGALQMGLLSGDVICSLACGYIAVSKFPF